MITEAKLTEIQTKGRQAVDAAKKIWDTAASAGRELTTAEQADFDREVAAAGDYAKKLREGRDDMAVHQKAMEIGQSLGMSGLQVPDWHPGAGHIGQPFSAGMRDKGRTMRAPALALPEPVLKAMHHAVRTGQNFSSQALVDELHTKAGFSTVESLLPPQLYPAIIGPAHPDRLMDRLPVMPIAAPSLEYLRHTSTTGTPAITAEGAQKPELVFVTDKLIAAVVKIAAHVAASYESLEDFSAFEGYVRGELTNQAIDAENSELLNGDGTSGHLVGLRHTSGVLVHAAGTDTGLDAIEMGITQMRVGPQLAVADLIVAHPSTWSSIRRSKDLQDRYLVTDDPTKGEASTAWGVEVLQTVVMPVGEALLLDTTRFGRVLLREPMNIKTGTDNTDFTHNLSRFIVEERLTMAVERPGAVLSITGL